MSPASPPYLEEICWIMCVCVVCEMCVCFECVSVSASVRVAHQRRVVLFPILRRATVLLVALRLGHLLGHRLVVVRPEAFALAGGDHADFVSPCVSVGTLQLDPACPGVRRDAAVVRGAAPPPFAPADGVGHEVGRHALARTHQLPDGFGAAAGSVGDVTGGPQLPTAQLRGTWGEKSRISRLHWWLRPKTNTLMCRTLRWTG